MYYLYIVKCKDGTLYTGITTDVQRRLAEHNASSKGAKYTRSRRPVKLVFTQRFRTRSSAAIREVKIKRLTRLEKINIFQSLPRRRPGKASREEAVIKKLRKNEKLRLVRRVLMK